MKNIPLCLVFLIALLANELYAQDHPDHAGKPADEIEGKSR
jgi:hypothetical protein